MRGLACALLLCLLTACATRPPGDVTPSPGERIAARAVAEVGQAYRFGGDAPGGFDCSGLARYVHAAEGLAIPRTAAEQFRSGARVGTGELRAGDLVFFRFGGREVDHVGVYVGEGAFVHAPGRGDRVQRAMLEAPWFSRRFSGAVRFWRE